MGSMRDIEGNGCSCPESWVTSRDKCDHFQPLCIDGHCMACGEFDPRGELAKFHGGKTRRVREEEAKATK